MNQPRRKELDKALALLSDALEIIQACSSDEREAYENMPEGLQNSERGERAGEAADALENAESELEQVVQYVEEAISQ